MSAEERYPVLIGYCAEGRKTLHGIHEVSDFICEHGLYEDLLVTREDGTPLLTTFGIYLNKISDMEYREELLKVLVPMQMKLDGTATIDDEVDGIVEDYETGMEM